jgi:hypothetical protein
MGSQQRIDLIEDRADLFIGRGNAFQLILQKAQTAQRARRSGLVAIDHEGGGKDLD